MKDKIVKCLKENKKNVKLIALGGLLVASLLTSAITAIEMDDKIENLNSKQSDIVESVVQSGQVEDLIKSQQHLLNSGKIDQQQFDQFVNTCKNPQKAVLLCGGQDAVHYSEMSEQIKKYQHIRGGALTALAGVTVGYYCVVGGKMIKQMADMMDNEYFEK